MCYCDIFTVSLKYFYLRHFKLDFFTLHTLHYIEIIPLVLQRFYHCVYTMKSILGCSVVQYLKLERR